MALWLLALAGMCGQVVGRRAGARGNRVLIVTGLPLGRSDRRVAVQCFENAEGRRTRSGILLESDLEAAGQELRVGLGSADDGTVCDLFEYQGSWKVWLCSTAGESHARCSAEISHSEGEKYCVDVETSKAGRFRIQCFASILDRRRGRSLYAKDKTFNRHVQVKVVVPDSASEKRSPASLRNLQLPPHCDVMERPEQEDELLKQLMKLTKGTEEDEALTDDAEEVEALTDDTEEDEARIMEQLEEVRSRRIGCSSVTANKDCRVTLSKCDPENR